MQQFLLPSSDGGTSQIINIPVSLLSQGNQQPISFITANGQIFQLPNFLPQNGENTNNNTNNANSNTNQNSAASNNSVNATSSSTASTASTTTTSTNQQQQALVINSQGQIISLPVLQPQNGQVTQQQNQQQNQNVQAVNAQNLNNFNQNTSNNNNNNSNNTNNNNQQTQQNQQNQQQQQTVSLSQINFASLTSNGVQLQTLNSANQNNTNRNAAAANNAQAVGNGGTPIKTLLEEDEIKSDNDMDDSGPTIANMPNNNLTTGIPQTHVTHHATTVDGVNLDEIREFAKAFKLRRLALGLTQTQVGQALSATKGPAYSQSAICRFEKLDITPKSAAKIKPVLEKWMQEAELKYADRLKTGNQQNFADLLGSDSTKKRKRRTSFTPQALEILNEAFEKNTHPSGNQGADMTMLANKLNYDREVIRVWFCNKRQALKNTIKKFKSNPGGLDDPNSTMSPEQMSPNQSQSQLNTSSQQIQQLQQQQVVQQVQQSQPQQQQLQQSPIQNNTQQVQNTVNVVSSISQSLGNVVTPASSSPKTVITLQCNTNPTNNNSQATTNTNPNNTPPHTTQVNAPSSSPPQTQNIVQATTLKIESTVPSQTITTEPQAQPEQQQPQQQQQQSHNL